MCSFEFFCILTLITTVSAHPYEVKAESIGAESAVVKWHTTEKNVQKFRVHCSGVRQYLSASNAPQSELHVVTHHVPGSATHILLGDIKPNYKYSCIVSEEFEENQSPGRRISTPVHFFTDNADPEEPRMPVVNKEGENVFKVELFPVSSKFGMIHGYKVQFHVIKEEDNYGKPIIEERMFVAFGKYALPSAAVAERSVTPVCFQLSYNNHSLPKYLLTNHAPLKTALKSNFKYSVVTLAYSKKKHQANSKVNLFTISEPTKAFIIKSNREAKSVSHGQPTPSRGPPQLGLAITVGVILPMLIVCWVGFVILFLSCRAQRIRLQLKKEKLRMRALEETVSEPTQQMGGLPWLTPEQDIKPQHSQSTPTLTHSAPALPTKTNSLIQFSPEPKHNLKSNIPERKSSAGTELEQKVVQSVESSPRDITIEVIHSPTKFYTAGDTESPSVRSDSEIDEDPSSLMFLPRGFSDGPLLPPGYGQSPIQQLLHQLSGGESGQEDQAPDMEIDPYEINID